MEYVIELNVRIDPKGCIKLPKEFQYTYGRQVKLALQIYNADDFSEKRRIPGSAKGRLKINKEDSEHLLYFNDYMV